MERKSLKELKELILQDIKCSKTFIENENIKNDTNPQMVKMVTQETARLEAMEDVLTYINTGTKCFFNKVEQK